MIDATQQPQFAGDLSKRWWLFLIRGLLGLALGVFALVYPGATLGAIVLLLGAYFIVSGIVTVVKSFSVVRSDGHWWILLLEGLLSLAVGLAVFAWPGLTALGLAFLVGYWAIITGVLAIITAFRFHAHVKGEWFYVLFGFVSLLFGLFVLMQPAAGLVYLIIMTSIYGFVVGITMIALAFRLRA